MTATSAPLGARPIIRQLRRRRIDLGLTQQVVADRIGMSQSRLCSLEWAEGLPPLDRLRAWAEALGFEVQLNLVDRSAS